jgi:hypothetical protein
LFFLCYAFLLDNLTFGCKETETKCNHTSFDKKVGCKLSGDFFWQVYRMEQHSFNKLFETLKPQLMRIFPHTVVEANSKIRTGIPSTQKLGSAFPFVFVSVSIPVTPCNCIAWAWCWCTTASGGVVKIINACREL